MTFSLATKLHMLLILTIVGVSLYMFMLYKEIRVFEKDIATLKVQVKQLTDASSSSTGTEQQQAVAPQPAMSSNNDARPHQARPADSKSIEAVITSNVDDDDISITSNEIKDILTNIQHVEEDDDIECIDADAPDVDGAKESKTRNESSCSSKDSRECNATCVTYDMTEEELNACKYDDLRNFLRRHGVNMRGSKTEMAKRIVELKESNSEPIA